MTKEHVIGVISDTHGLLRPEAVALLADVELIIHAGDIGSASIIKELSSICPVRAIRGNVDSGPWAVDYPDTLSFTFAGKNLHVLHDLKELNRYPAACNTDIIISGHSHRPLIKTIDEVLYVNPGSAGRRRFTLPVSVARLSIRGATVNAEILELAL